LSRRLKEEPLVPLGVALTCFALYKASRSIRTGNKEYTNRMFRARIYAQAFTIAAMIGGSYYYQDQREKEKNIAQQVAEQNAKDKQQAWIRELEIRDQEDKEVRFHVGQEQEQGLTYGR
jgi:ribosomal protein S11